jgi:hypothetical protein
MAVRLSALRDDRLYSQEDPLYSFLLEAKSIPAQSHSAAGRIRSIEKST